MLVIFLFLFSAVAPSLAAADNMADGAGQSAPAAFSDIGSHWAKAEIMELAAANIVAGFVDGTFQPSGKITREQFLKMLVELEKYPKDAADEPFKDVGANRWSAPYAAAGVKYGILVQADYPDGNFKPSQPITRYEMAVWIVRALKLTPQQDEQLLGKLKDQATVTANRDLIEAALRSGIIRGYPDGAFKGGANSTRAEAAVMLVRALHYAPGQPTATPTTPANPTTPSSPTSGPHKIVEYRPEVKRSKSTDYSMRDGNTWVITDPSLTLKAGDIFVMPPNAKYYGGIAKKVVSVKKENGALVVKTSVPRLKEVFAKLDISTTEVIDPKTIKPIDSSVKITRSEVAVQSASATLPCMNLAMNNAAFQGVTLDASMNFCNLGVKADIGLDVDIDWFDVDLDFYSSLVLTGDITTKVHAVANAGNSTINEPKFIPLTTPFFVPVFTGVFVKGQLFLRIDPDFQASIVVDFNDKFHLEEGFSLSSSHGLQGIDKTTNTASLNVDSKLNASIAAGPDVQLTLTLLDIAYAGFDLYPGISAGFNRNYEQGRCDSINVDAFLRLDVIAGYDIWIASDEWRKNLVNAKYSLYDADLTCPPPQAPTNLTAKLVGVRGSVGQFHETIINRTDVQLSWNAVADATSYNVKRSETPGGPATVKRTNGPILNDATTTIGKTYYYQVTALNEHGEGKPSAALKVTVTVQPPPAPKNLTETRGGAEVVLKWDDVGGFALYNVKRADGAGTNFTTIATNVSGTTFTDTKAALLKSYTYVVTAVDAGGESGPSNAVHAPIANLQVTPIDPGIIVTIPTVTLLPVPANFNAYTDVNSGKIVLTWSAVKGATGYDVQRSTAANGTFQTIGTNVSGTTYTDTTAAYGTTYYYKVKAVKGTTGQSTFTPVKSATPGSGIR